MSRQRLIIGCALTATIAAAIGISAPQANERPMDLKKKGRLSVEQRRLEERKRLETDRKWVLTQTIREDASSMSVPFDQTIVTDSEIWRTPRISSVSAPPPSPGLNIGVTLYDYQANSSQAYNLARTPAGEWIHFTWTNMNLVPFEPGSVRNVKYMAIDPESPLSIPEGRYNGSAFTSTGNHAGHCNIDVNVNNVPSIGLHMRDEDTPDPYLPWAVSFPSAPDPTAVYMQLGGIDGSCAEVLWARLTADRSNEVLHEVAHSNVNDCPTHKLWYWRFNPTLGNWQGPAHIDDTEEISYVLAVDANSDKVAVAVHVTVGGLSNVAYIETASDGLNWLNGTEIPPSRTVITNYDDPQGPQAWVHLTTTYDNSGVLHIMWDEQRFPNSGQSAIKHWNSSRNTIRTAAISYWDNPAANGIMSLNFSKLSMGIGDGSTLCENGAESNDNYVYALYTQFGGPTEAERADHSLQPSSSGYMNGELYLTSSNTGGYTWAPPVNLTNTKTPSCYPGLADQFSGEPQYPDSVCRSEHWATIGRVVHDIDILFISDLDAGGIPQGEGSLQSNPVHYLQLPGGTTNAPFVCPLIAPYFAAALSSDPDCEYHASQFGQDEATLSIMNLGNADLEGEISILDFPGAPELSISAPGPYTITAGDPDLHLTVTMAANSAPEGLYSGTIVITHNDTSQQSPQEFGIDFFVFNAYYCPEDPVWLRTGVTSGGEPGCLTLGVGEDGSIANEQQQGGLWRHPDSSSSIFDGSLLVAHGAQGPDTIVFLSFSTRPTNGQNGLRPQSELVIDTSAYGTGTGCATAYAKMSTRDSVVGISVEWFYPQDLGRDEFILSRYKFYRFTPEVPVSDLAIGMLIDFDVLPALRLGAVQDDARNAPGSDATRNLLWVRGVDTAGHIPTSENTATRFRAGMIAPDGMEGALFGISADDILPNGGPSDGFLYQQLQSLSGIDLNGVSDTDLYVLATLARGQSIAEGETLSVTIIFVSDTISETSLKATTDLALADYLTICQPCFCLCLHDPNCDGVISDVLDVVGVIDIAFRGVPSTTDEFCPIQRSDVDADGATAITDVVRVINVAFRGQSVSANYVDPCAP